MGGKKRIDGRVRACVRVGCLFVVFSDWFQYLFMNAEKTRSPFFTSLTPRLLRIRFPNVLAGYLAAAAGVGLATLLIGLIINRPAIPHISMIYLIVVLGVAALYGSRPAIVASVLAFFAFDWFFVVPIHTLTISDPDEWLSLLLFLVTGMVTGQLAARQRERAIEAQRREQEALALYELGRMMNASINLDPVLPGIAERLCAELHLMAVSILLPDANGALQEHAPRNERIPLNADEWETAAWVFGHGQRQGLEQPTGLMRLGRILAEVRVGARRHAVIFAPLKGGTRTEGVLRLLFPGPRITLMTEESRFLIAAADQLGLAIERDRLRAEANRAEVLRRTDELRTALLNAVSHDLRSPLAAIKVATEDLLRMDMELDHATWHKMAGLMNQEVDRLNRLVANLLDISRIEAGALQPEKELYPIGELLRAVIARLAPLTQAHHVSIELAEDLPLVPLDYSEIDQVLTNLLENAVHYTPQQTPICIAAQVRGDELQVAVSDRGPGIPADETNRIFERFYRLDSQRGKDGSGLGLAVCKGLVQAHGGRIWVEDTPGGGTTCIFTLPLEKGAAGPQAMAVNG